VVVRYGYGNLLSYTMKISSVVLITFLLLPTASSAVDVAPRISDREIIESLAEIKAELREQKNLVNQRFEAMNQRFEVVNQRFDSVNQRFDSMDKRFAFVESLMIATLLSIFGLIGFIVWDRKTALRPLEKRLERIEIDLDRDLELKTPEGSRLTRLIHALRELAPEDPKLANVLRTYYLL
jgi:hypothetical protein